VQAARFEDAAMHVPVEVASRARAAADEAAADGLLVVGGGRWASRRRWRGGLRGQAVSRRGFRVHAPGPTPDGRSSTEPFCTAEYDFTLRRARRAGVDLSGAPSEKRPAGETIRTTVRAGRVLRS